MKIAKRCARTLPFIGLMATSAFWVTAARAMIKRPAHEAHPNSERAATNARVDPSVLLAGSVPATSVSNTEIKTTDIGPERGFVIDLDGFVINPSNSREILVATGTASVFKSSDGGRSWHNANNGLTNILGGIVSVSNIRRDPRSPRTVYAACDNGLYRSSDFGDHWTQLSDTFGLIDVAVSALDPSLLFVVGDNGFYKSTDGGVTLVAQTGIGLEGPLFVRFSNVVFTPADPQTLFVVDENNGVYKSTDGGTSFNLLPAAPFFPAQVFPHPTRRDTIFVEAFGGTAASGLFRSNDGGATFTEVTGGLPAGVVQFVTFDPQNPDIVYASSTNGLLQSSDGGVTFLSLGLTPNQLDSVRGGAITLGIDPGNPRTLYVNTGRGDFKSVDRGRSFFEINNGFRATKVESIALDTDDDQTLYVVANGELLKSRDDGRHYNEIKLPGDPSSSTVAVAPTNRNLILVATTESGLLRSSDGGQTWSNASIDTGVTGLSGARLVFDPRDADNVYLVWGFLSRSTDGGQTFTTNSSFFSLTSTIAVDPRHSNVVYLSGGNGLIPPALMLKSTDGGVTFADALTAFGVVRSIVVDPQHSNIVYVAGFLQLEFGEPYPQIVNLVLRSDDDATAFVPADGGIQGLTGSLNALQIDSENPSRLFTLINGFGVFETNNRGTNWSLLDQGGESFRRAGQLLMINPTKPSRLYLAPISLLELRVGSL